MENRRTSPIAVLTAKLDELIKSFERAHKFVKRFERAFKEAKREARNGS